MKKLMKMKAVRIWALAPLVLMSCILLLPAKTRGCYEVVASSEVVGCCCIRTVKYVCCNGPSSCVQVTTTECY